MKGVEAEPQEKDQSGHLTLGVNSKRRWDLS